MRRVAILAASLTLTGCATLPWSPSSPPPEGVVAAGAYTRPAISIGPKGVVRVAAEGPKMGSIHLWTWTGKAWDHVEIVRSSPSTASRVYVPDIEGAVVSWRYGNKEGGPMRGPGYWQDGKTFYPGLTEGAARLATGPDGVILMSKGGAWVNVSTGQRGGFPAGLTGEKFDFCILGGKWATAHNGFSGQSSRIVYDGKATTWADHAAYPDQGSDLNYPSVTIAGGRAWAASVYAGRLCVNSFDGKALGWPSDAILDAGPATVQERCPPRLCAPAGRAVAVWQNRGLIYAADVEAVATGQARPVLVATGTMPDAAVAPDGSLRLVYLSDGAVRYKEVHAP